MIRFATAYTQSDRAENSIMQTISIAVSAILIAAGLITAPSLINNARDTNAKQDLANIAHAQNFALSNNSDYADSLTSLNANTEVKLTTSTDPSGIRLIAGSTPNKCYVAFVQSASGKMYYSASDSAKIYQAPVPWPSVAPSTYPSSCAWPMSSAAAVSQVTTNMLAERFGSGFNTFVSRTSSIQASGGIAGRTYTRVSMNVAATISNWGPFNGSMPTGSMSPTKEYQASAWIRVSKTQKFAMGSENRNSSGTNIGNVWGPTVQVPAGVWTRLNVLIPKTAGISQATLVLYGTESIPVVAGDTVDYDGFMLTEGSVLHDYADGNTPGWSWDGAPNASSSTGYPYTVDSIIGEPDAYVEGTATKSIAASPLAGRVAFFVYNVTGATSNYASFGRVGPTAYTGLTMQGGGAGLQSMAPRVDTVGGSVNSTLALTGTRSNGRHVIAVAIDEGMTGWSIKSELGLSATAALIPGSGVPNANLYAYGSADSTPIAAVVKVAVPDSASIDAMIQMLANKYGVTIP